MSVEEVCRKYSTDIVQVSYSLQSNEESHNDPVRVVTLTGVDCILSIFSLYFPDMNWRFTWKSVFFDFRLSTFEK